MLIIFSMYFSICLLMLAEICETNVHRKLSSRQNVLFIIVDDLRPLAGDVHLPIMKRMEEGAITFKNAFAQQALCAPSRNSLLTGRRPDSLRLYDFYSYWRTTPNVGNFTTMPELFKKCGYNTFSAGKVFHPGISSNYTDDYPYSWSSNTYHPPTEIYKNAKVCRNAQTKRFEADLVCPVDVHNQPGESLPDLQTLDYAIDLLKEIKNESKPFFLAVGFHKPHIPFRIPEKYMDQIDINKIHLPLHRRKPFAMPSVAFQPWTDIRKRQDIHRLKVSFPYGVIPKKWTLKIRQSYYASALYIDDLLGKLMSHINLRNTIVVMTSDHGWSLGENGLWAKYSNFDSALRVPLIIKVPNIKRKQIYNPVELIDIFPTLVDLTHINPKIPYCKRKYLQLCFEGKSLLPLAGLKSTFDKMANANFAISQYPRPSQYPASNTDEPRLKNIFIMGYSIRTIRYRFTQWIRFHSCNFTRDWDKIYGGELYDHNTDMYEANNLYENPKYKSLSNSLSDQLRSVIGA